MKLKRFFKVFAIILFFQVSAQANIPRDAKIYVAGHAGLVGSAIMRKLEEEGYTNILTRSSKELDLRKQALVENFFQNEKPEYVFLAAAKVGGIQANWDFPAEFIYDNLMIEANVIHAAYNCRVKKLLFLGSSCIYPRKCPQPIHESYLLTKPLEKTNEFYAIAKIAGIKLCQGYNRQYGSNFICCMPTNLYGPGDNFDLATSHVLPALIAKMCTAKEENQQEVEIWGTGTPRREFLHVDDLADAAFFLMQNYDGSEIVNIGCGEDLQISELAYLVKESVGFEGDLVFNSSKPDGTPQKLLDVSTMTELGWTPKISLENGLEETVKWYKDNYN